MLITLRLDLIHTRLNGLRAANSSLPVGVLSFASVSLSSLFLCLVSCPVSVVGLARRVGECLCFGFCFLFSLLFFLCLLLAVSFCARRGLLSSLLPLGR